MKAEGPLATLTLLQDWAEEARELQAENDPTGPGTGQLVGLKPDVNRGCEVCDRHVPTKWQRTRTDCQFILRSVA
jgi:hypothetical protein